MKPCRALAALAATSLAVSALADPPPPPAWDSQLSLGMNLASGNTESQEARAELTAKKETEDQAWKFSAEGAYAETDDQTTADRAKLLGRYDLFITEREFGSTQITFEYDDPAALHQRVVFGPALGYFLVKEETARLSVEAGPSYVNEKVGEEERQFVVLRLAERFDRDLGNESKLWEAAEYLPDIEQNGNFLANAEAGIEAAVKGPFSLKLKIEDRYNSKPAEGKEENDVLVTSAVCYKL